MNKEDDREHVTDFVVSSFPRVIPPPRRLAAVVAEEKLKKVEMVGEQ